MTPDRPSDPPLQHGALPSGPMAWTDTGEGPALLLIHGLPGTNRDWRWLSPGLETTHRVIRPDLPGFGESPHWSDESLRVDGRAAAVCELIDTLALERVVVVGHSMGGPVALRVANARPAQVVGLGLLASPGLRRHRALRPLLVHGMATALRAPGLGRLLRPALRAIYAAGGFPKSLSDEARVNTMVAVQGFSFEDQRREVARLSRPTFVSWAEDDPLVEGEIVRELGEACPAGPRQPFATGGHNIQKSQAVEIAAELGPWALSLQQP